MAFKLTKVIIKLEVCFAKNCCSTGLCIGLFAYYYYYTVIHTCGSYSLLSQNCIRRAPCYIYSRRKTIFL